ncbi:hypothetical protein Gohar_028414 [Gossypium harknessii]|uniref:RNase H type-1 domain-containing protein n=1 Tax=Gossypium harknessii TaxID=34285 RepID=A0A7J9ICG3_9ROSI|nr:hypothetical protein [Gossypium harknessii]
MFGFAMRVSVSDIFQIEERVIYEGLFLTWQKGFRKVVIKSDNALLVDLIGNGYAADNCMDKVANSELNKLSLFDVIPTHVGSVFEDDLHQVSIFIGL